METTHINENERKYMEEYLKTFNKKEKQAYDIAQEHLGTTFQLEKSIGYLNWKKENKIK